mgnify:CR=1 FL=1
MGQYPIRYGLDEFEAHETSVSSGIVPQPADKNRKRSSFGTQKCQAFPSFDTATKAETSPSRTDIHCVYVVNKRLTGFIHSYRFEGDVDGNSFPKAKSV